MRFSPSSGLASASLAASSLAIEDLLLRYSEAAARLGYTGTLDGLELLPTPWPLRTLPSTKQSWYRVRTAALWTASSSWKTPRQTNWSPAVTGNMILIGTNLTYHSSTHGARCRHFDRRQYTIRRLGPWNRPVLFFV